MTTSCALEHHVRAHIQTLLMEAQRERLLAPARQPGVWTAVWAAVRTHLMRVRGKKPGMVQRVE